MTPARFSRLSACLERRQPDLTILADNVHKPHNLSAIVRTCDAVGVLEAHAVWPPGSVPTFHDTSGGAHRWVPIRSHATLAQAASVLKQSGHQLVAADLSPRAKDFRELDYTQPTAFVLGAEREGVSPAALELCDTTVCIPMLGLVESLNVSVAAAVMLFEASRQRQAAGLYKSRRIDDSFFETLLFEWAYPEIASLCRSKSMSYPPLSADGDILGEVPRG